MKTNKDLTPTELALYTYRNQSGTRYLSIIRKEDIVFATSIERIPSFTDQYWNELIDQLSTMTCRSMNFYLHHGVTPEKASPELLRKSFEERHYPLIYIVDDEIVNQ